MAQRPYSNQSQEEGVGDERKYDAISCYFDQPADLALVQGLHMTKKAGCCEGWSISGWAVGVYPSGRWTPKSLPAAAY